MAGEDGSRSSTASLQSLNRSILQQHMAISSTFASLAASIQSLAQEATGSLDRSAALRKCLELLGVLGAGLKTLGGQFSSKAAMEQRLTASLGNDVSVAHAVAKTVSALERLQQRLLGQQHLLLGANLAVAGVFGSSLAPGLHPSASVAAGVGSPLHDAASRFFRRFKVVEEEEATGGRGPAKALRNNATSAESEEELQRVAAVEQAVRAPGNAVPVAHALIAGRAPLPPRVCLCVCVCLRRGVGRTRASKRSWTALHGRRSRRCLRWVKERRWWPMGGQPSMMVWGA